MPIIKSAKKQLRSGKRKRAFNERRKRAMKSTIKVARASVTDAESLRLAYQAIDKAAKRGVIKKNTAARKKSRLAKALAKADKK